MTEDIKVLVGELLEGKKDSHQKIRSIISNDLNKATLFFAALEGYCEQENKIAKNVIETYNDMQAGLISALSDNHSEQIKSEILRIIDKIIDSIDEIFSKKEKSKQFTKYMIIGGVAVGALIAVKNPQAAKELLHKVVKLM